MSALKPGDVVAVEYGGRSVHGIVDTDGRFYTTDQSMRGVPANRPMRPLVVIDPENREQIERLTDIYDTAVIRMHEDPDPREVTPEQRTTAMQAALREFANPTPPKPEEPTGLGAVVEDADGLRWSLLPPHVGKRWACWDEAKFDRDYSDLDVVRVLDEGVRDA